jgi:endonuclease-3 related protein
MTHYSEPASAPILTDLYHRLYDAYGPRGWWPGEGAFEVIIGAILTQAASWKNVELALANLKAADCWSFQAIDACPPEELAGIVRPSGYFNTKAAKLKAFAAHVMERYDGDLALMFAQETACLRQELLSIHGIGPETADDVLVYAAGKPSFVIDTYTVRILERLGIVPDNGRRRYADWQALVHDNLTADVGLFNEFHALLDHHAGQACRKSPMCHGCCLLPVCATGQQSLDPGIATNSD